MRHLLLLSAFIICTNLSAQWQQTILPLDDAEDLRGISLLNNAEFFICSNTQISKTTDGGQNWQVTLLNANFPSGPFWANTVRDLHFFNAGQGLATGEFNLTNDEMVISSGDGGANWSVAYVNSPFNPPAFFNALDVRGSDVLACGWNGHIIRSQNQGNSFTAVNNSPGLELYDVKFVNASRAIAVGSNAVLTSNNGGSSWSSHPTFAGSGASSIAVTPDGLVYITSAGALLRSTDGGSTFTSAAIPVLASINSMAATHDTIFFSTEYDGIFVSTNGGLHWQQFESTQSQVINKIEIHNGKVYALCDDKTLLVLEMASMQPEPVSFFSIDGVPPAFYCTGDSLFLNNQSALGSSYTWLYNGVVFSTDYNAGLQLTAAGGATISLIVTNANGTDTSTIGLNVLGIPVFEPFTVLVNTQDTVCNGTVVKFTVPVTDHLATYQLRAGTVPLGNPIQGNLGQRVFTAPPLSGTTHFNILAIKSNACYTDSLVVEHTIFSATMPASTPFTLSRDSACYYDSVFLVVPNSRPGYRYTWYNHSSGTTGNQYIQGNGGTISIPLPLLDSSQIVAPRAVSNQLGCSGIFSPGKQLIVQRPEPYFSLNNFNPELGESVYLLNSSTNPSGDYLWDFGAGATPPFSSAANPANITYNSTGQKTIKLLTTTPYGCKDSTEHTIIVLDAIAVEACRFAQVASLGSNGEPLSLTKDYQGNTIFWYNSDGTSKHKAFSNHGDSIVIIAPDDWNYRYGHALTKFNPKGVPQWTTQIRHNSPWTRQGDVETDEAGNIYCTYFHGEYLDSVRIYSTDGRYLTIDPPSTGSATSVLVMKFNKDGIFQWYNTSFAASVERLDLKIDNVGNLYVCGNGLYKYDSNGQLLWSHQGQSYAAMDLDSEGFVWTCNIWHAKLKKFDPTDGNLLFEGVTHLNMNVSSLKIDVLNNIYLAGGFQDTIRYDNKVIGPYPGTIAHSDAFLCKMKPDGREEWIKTFHSKETNAVKGLEIKNNHILLMVTASDTVRTQSLPPLPLGGRGHYLFHTDSLSGAATIAKLYEDSAPFFYINNRSLIRFSQNSEALALAFDFNTNFQFAGTSVKPYEMPPLSTTNIFIAEGNLDCFLPPIPATNTPYSYFLPSTLNTCAGESIDFQDISSNNPSAWQWSFPGGTPAISSAQNPTVTYSTPGTYTATLTSSNAFGVGTTFHKSIQVIATPIISIEGDSIVPVTSNVWLIVTTNDPNATYQWQDSTSTHSWADMVDQTYDVLSFAPELTDDGNKYRCVVNTYCGPYLTRAIGITVPTSPVKEVGKQAYSVQLLPNPSPGVFSVALPAPATPDMAFQILGLQGQALRTQSVKVGSAMQTVQADDLPAGLYFLQVLAAGQVLAVEKFVKD